MKKIIVALVCVVALTSCNKIERMTDSEISAIRDQTEVLKAHNELVKEQNKILTQIANKIK